MIHDLKVKGDTLITMGDHRVRMDVLEKMLSAIIANEIQIPGVEGVLSPERDSTRVYIHWRVKV